jgi:23S rRNA (adenine-N6)-dimethyltransferase
MSRSRHGGRHELGQNFLVHQPTIRILTALVAATDGGVLELGAGDGAVTHPLSRLGRRVTAIDIDEHRVARLARALPGVTVAQADALRHPMTAPVIVGNIPFHLTTPLLRRLLSASGWRRAVLVTQWEVARKRAGVGGGTMMTAQAAPWFAFALHGRVPRGGFRPAPSVDGGVLVIDRRRDPLVAARDRRAYEHFAARTFTGSGARLDRLVAGAARVPLVAARRALNRAGVKGGALPRDLSPEQWAQLWRALR